MKQDVYSEIQAPEVLTNNKLENVSNRNNESAETFDQLEQGIYAVMETYSNVHRGSGHNSMITTHLFEQSRIIILEYLGLNKSKYTVVFCTPRRAKILIALLKPTSYKCLSGNEIGLSIGVVALAVKKNALPQGVPFQTGGGTAKLMSKDWVIWDNVPGKFEAGTPAIINVITFTRALRLQQQSGNDIFKDSKTGKLTASEILYSDELEKYSGKELLEKLRQTKIGRGLLVPTLEGTKPFINLDNSASTPTFDPVWNAFRHTLRQPLKVQQEIIHEARTICSKFLGASLDTYDIIFTSNTTEAINLVAESLGSISEEEIEPVVINTLLEHSSNDLPWRMIPGHSLIRLPVDADGFMDLQELEILLSDYNQEKKFGKKRIKIVAISGASNVLGVCNNIKEISEIVHQFGAQLLVDAAQLVAHRKIYMERNKIDYLAFSAHKVYAPFGSGALIVRKGLLNFKPEEIETIHSSGEENAGGIAALGKALVILNRIGMDIIQEEEQALTSRTLRGLEKIPGLKIFGIKDPESPDFAHKIGVIVFISDKMMSNKLAKELALQSGIGVRFGCHCAHIIVKQILNIPPVLEKFQKLIQTLFPKLRLPGVLRVSLGIENSKEDIDRLIQMLEIIAGKDNKTKIPKNSKHNLAREDVQQQIKNFIKAKTIEVYS